MVHVQPDIEMRRKLYAGSCLSIVPEGKAQEEICLLFRAEMCVLFFINCLLLTCILLFCLLGKNELNTVACLVMDCRTLTTAGIKPRKLSRVFEQT